MIMISYSSYLVTLVFIYIYFNHKTVIVDAVLVNRLNPMQHTWAKNDVEEERERQDTAGQEEDTMPLFDRLQLHTSQFQTCINQLKLSRHNIRRNQLQ